jgi:hypothetical protein
LYTQFPLLFQELYEDDIVSIQLKNLRLGKVKTQLMKGKTEFKHLSNFELLFLTTTLQSTQCLSTVSITPPNTEKTEAQSSEQCSSKVILLWKDTEKIKSGSTKQFSFTSLFCATLTIVEPLSLIHYFLLFYLLAILFILKLFT